MQALHNQPFLGLFKLYYNMYKPNYKIKLTPTFSECLIDFLRSDGPVPNLQDGFGCHSTMTE